MAAWTSQLVHLLAGSPGRQGAPGTGSLAGSEQQEQRDVHHVLELQTRLGAPLARLLLARALRGRGGTLPGSALLRYSSTWDRTCTCHGT